MIVNTDKINESGEHWLGLFFDINGTCNFFDPFKAYFQKIAVIFAVCLF
jgi:hypothetical protein